MDRLCQVEEALFRHKHDMQELGEDCGDDCWCWKIQEIVEDWRDEHAPKEA